MGFDDPIMKAIDKGGGQECDVAGVLRELDAAGYAIVLKDPPYNPMLTAGRDAWITFERGVGPDVFYLRADLIRTVWKAMLAASKPRSAQ